MTTVAFEKETGDVDAMTFTSNESVLEFVKKENIGLIQLWFTDVLGVLKGFAIAPSELEEALNEGMGFDGSSIHGFARIEESDLIAKPDISTFQGTAMG